MGESVFDASFIGYANGPLEELASNPSGVLGHLARAVEEVAAGRGFIRCNPKLLTEYDRLVKEYRNDLIVEFISLLDSGKTIRLTSSSLSRQENARAERCNWPQHDRHLLAAAVGGSKVTIHVTEPRLGQCSPRIWRLFEIRVNFVPIESKT
jgi:hypothetical protein